MVDEIARFPDIFRAMVALPEAAAGRLRYLAHFGVPGLAAHAPLRASLRRWWRRWWPPESSSS